MTNVIRFKESRIVRSSRRTVWVLAVAAVVAGSAGVMAAAAIAGPAIGAGEASRLLKEGEFNEPALEDGVLRVEGTNAGDRIALRLQAGQPGILEVDVGDDGLADFAFERASVASIIVNAGNGDDLVRVDESNGVFTDSIATTIEGGNRNDQLVGGSGAGTLSGGNGNDSLVGGPGAETLLGGNGDDSIDGNKGSDLAVMGNGSDTFVWDNGDGSDTIEGQNGADTMVFNGANGDEQFDLSANGNRLRFFRLQGNILMDTAGVERVDVNALNVDLAGTPGATSGDGQADRVIVNATDGNDTINVSGDADAVNVAGLAPTVRVLHAQVANDRLDINTLLGTDTVNPGGLAAGLIQLFVDGALVP